MQHDRFITRPMSIMLDAIRGLAALAVLIGHGVQLRLYNGPWPFSQVFQHYAVVVFFVLSGLVIANSVMHGNRTLRDYVLARVARVVPMAALAVLAGLAAYALCLQVGLITGGDGGRYGRADLAAFVLPLVFMSESAGGSGPVWNPPFWSLVYEVWYYIIFGAVWFLRGRIRVLTLALAIMLAGFNVLLMLPVWLIGVALARYAPARTLSPVAGAACVLFGLFLLKLADLQLLDWMRGFLALTGIERDDLRFSKFFLSDFLFGIGVAVTFIGLRPLADRSAAVLEKARTPICWLAECSFTIYLLHWPLLSVFKKLGVGAGGNFALFLVMMAGVVALLAQVARVIEHRRGAFRARLERRFVPSAPAVPIATP